MGKNNVQTCNSTGHLAEILCPSHSPKFLLVFRVAFCGVSCSANSVHKDCKTRIGAGRKSKVKIDPTHPRTDNLATLSARQAAPMLALLSTLNLGYNLHSAKNNQSPGYWNSCWCYLGSKLKMHRNTHFFCMCWHKHIQSLPIVDTLWSNSQFCKHKQKIANGLEIKSFHWDIVAWKHLPRNHFANHTMFLIEIVIFWEYTSISHFQSTLHTRIILMVNIVST